MSNHKHAYGWIGHILCRKSEGGNRRENVIPVPDEVFDRIAKDMEDCQLDRRIKVEQLGWISIETVYYLATGTAFTEGWEHYGAPFKAAEEPREKHVERDAKYLVAMREIYGLTLPPSRLMVGCSSEH